MAICTIFAGNYKDNIDINSLEEAVKKSNFNFVGYFKNETNTNIGTGFAINENTMITNASSLQKIIFIPDTSVVNGKVVISRKEIERNWIDNSNLKLIIDGREYTIEKIIPHPDYIESNSYSPDIAMIITNEGINCNYPQRSNSNIEGNLSCSVIGYEKSIVYGTNTVDTTFSSNSISYCNISLDTNDKKNNSTVFEFIPNPNDQGFALIKEIENGVVLIGLLQNNQSNDKESVFLDLFDLGEWLNSNAISQITK